MTLSRYRRDLVENNVIDAIAGYGTLTAAIAAGGGGGGGAEATFETVSQNLSARSAVLGYSGGDLVTINYAGGVVKTFGYSDGRLVTITLSGATPDGVDLVKTLTYTGDDLTGVSYA